MSFIVGNDVLSKVSFKVEEGSFKIINRNEEFLMMAIISTEKQDEDKVPRSSSTSTVTSSSSSSSSNSTSSSPSTSKGVPGNARHIRAGRHSSKITRKPRAPRGKKAENCITCEKRKTGIIRVPRAKRAKRTEIGANAGRPGWMLAFNYYENDRLAQLPRLTQRERNNMAARKSHARARVRDEAERRKVEAVHVENANYRRRITGYRIFES